MNPQTLIAVKFHVLALGLLFLSLCACRGPDELASRTSSKDLASRWTLLSGGTIWPDAHAKSSVQAVLARDGIVIQLGTMEEVLEQLPQGVDVRRIDIDGGVAVPGLIDAHGHLLNLGETLESVDLVGCESYGELIQRVADAAREVPAGTWIRGRGWDQTRWPENSFPHHLALSKAVPHHPVFLSRVDGHAALVNRAALAIAGMDKVFGQEPEIEGGRVLLDQEHRPTGVLIDTAMGLVRRQMPAIDAKALERRALAAQDFLLSVGLVGVHEMGLQPDQVAVLEDLDRRGLLRLRVIGYLAANQPLAADLLARYPGERDSDPRSTLRIIGAKLMLDGAMGSRGAALLEPYSDAPSEVGLLRMDAEHFQARLNEVVDAGLQPATHAIGDRANRLVLDAYERRMERDPGFRALRPRIEHAQLVAPSDRPRFEGLGVIPSMQPTHCTSDMRWIEERVGSERSLGAYAWQSLKGEEAPLALGSDFPVERPNPMEGLYAATTRTDIEGNPKGGWHPSETLDARAALAGFTSGATYAAGEESFRGSLRLGCAMDVSVFDKDPIQAESRDLLSAKVRMVVIDGEIMVEN